MEMDINKIKNFLSALEQGKVLLTKLSPEKIVLLHHNDSDGLTSGAILSSALERAGFNLVRYCLEKPYPKVLKKILAGKLNPGKTLLLFTDFGSGMLSEIIRLKPQESYVMVLDHHGIEPNIQDEKLSILNPLLYGIDGSSACSSSTVAYLFAKALDPKNENLSHLGMLGALGDKHLDQSGYLTGLNKKVFEEAKEKGLAKLEREYFIKFSDFEAGRKVSEHLDALGGFGYLAGGPEIALSGLLGDFRKVCWEKGDLLRVEYARQLNDFLRSVKLRVGKSTQWFNLGEYFSGMGVKTVGLVCESLSTSVLVDPEKYTIGFQPIPHQIPNVGDFQFNESKVSMRVSPKLHQKIKEGKAPSISEVLPPAIKSLSGFVDACHIHAGAGTVTTGMEARLVEELEKNAREWS